jgi:hypothetical protein
MLQSRRPFLRLSAAPLVAAGLICAAPVRAAAPASAVETVCEHVVGLAPGERHYAACVESLTDSLAGVRPTHSSAGPATPTPGGPRSYFGVSRSIAAQRMRLACERLGVDPAQAEDCVARLRASLSRASAPAT